MKKWILKAIIQKVISWLPASQNINFLFQKYVTKGVQLSDTYFTDKLIHAEDHLMYFRKHGKTEGFKALELGSGWYPVIPVSLFLAGADTVTSIDVSALMKRKGIHQTIQKFLEWQREGKLQMLDPYILPERLQALKKLDDANLNKEQLLKGLHLSLQVRDARDTGFKAEEFDLVCSNNTFEHIYPAILKPILKEFQRILKAGGIMSHFIDMSDHFAHLDDSINIYNFLQYSEKQWARIDNTVQPQNRLRLRDYQNMYKQLGIEIIDISMRNGEPGAVQQMKLHKDFDGYTPAEIAVSHAHIISGK